ncbi:MAG: PhoH family protein [Clostridia bacterium]|nr:PhoH family protein [Clostridia bacterium]
MIATSEEIKLHSDIFFKLSGAMDSNLEVMEKRFGVLISATNDGAKVSGEAQGVENCARLIRLLTELIKQGQTVSKVLVERCADMIAEGDEGDVLDMFKETVAVTARGKKIVCKTLAQRSYVRAIKKNTLTFAVGPAGTGKTYLAVALAVNAFKRGEVERIILTRPAIEAGEKLGFLPGDLQMKVDPYLRPLYDALEEMFGVDNYSNLIEKGIIEIAPLAFMRGRTLHRSFIILDEGQNTTEEQMKMFLTRLGDGSKVVVTGDITQIDLPHGGRSGLKQATQILSDIDGIAVCRLTDKDVVRHELVQKIVKAYDKAKEE